MIRASEQPTEKVRIGIPLDRQRPMAKHAAWWPIPLAALLSVALLVVAFLLRGKL